MNHLTDEQMADWLAGEATPEAQAHLRDCSQCHDEAAALRDGISRYSFAVRVQAAHSQSSHLAGSFTPARPFAAHRLRWAGAATLVLLLAAQTAWMTRPHRNVPPNQPNAVTQQNPQPSASMSDDELLDAVNNDLNRDVPQALAPVSAITVARNQIAASTNAAGTSDDAGK